ncbi:hypothetical protein [Burkholderia sp. IMCC1007]|uniref:hypothetical protein n=1 Tax=Burkholderia sp. IMCC1007 TaxID=3004104 RepID=UPI0022B51F46|nr:hypothetical protein [Burkholderia sp. IMCC1007]
MTLSKPSKFDAEDCRQSSAISPTTALGRTPPFRHGVPSEIHEELFPELPAYPAVSNAISRSPHQRARHVGARTFRIEFSAQFRIGPAGTPRCMATINARGARTCEADGRHAGAVLK